MMERSQEARFLSVADTAEPVSGDTGEAMRRLDDWFQDLVGDLDAGRLRFQGLNAQHALAAEAEAVNLHIRDSMAAWARRWASLQPARELSDAFGDKVVLLVFGKFNAGKSSFCNFLAERFVRNGRAPRYFHVEGGRFVESAEGFGEGATETTARLQGVVLREKLVLLDTPGLHSLTPENAALTQRYMDSADGVLWLTSSTSPGQVQELDELARELRRNKPLLPVVTRSDVFEEDEIDGEIRKLLRNKTAGNRRQQETDVAARAAEKLRQLGVAPESLLPPLSVSVHTAREGGQTAEAMRDAGFERLYEAMRGIAGPALAYKRRKPVEFLLHHFEENVLGSLLGETLPRLAELGSALKSEKALLEQRRMQAAKAVWRTVIPSLPGLLDRHAAPAGGHDAHAVCDDVSQLFGEAFNERVSQDLAGYDLDFDASATRIVLDAETSHERLYAALESALQACLARLADDAQEQCRNHLDSLALSVRNLRERLGGHALRLRDMQRALRESVQSD